MDKSVSNRYKIKQYFYDMCETLFLFIIFDIKTLFKLGPNHIEGLNLL